MFCRFVCCSHSRSVDFTQILRERDSLLKLAQRKVSKSMGGGEDELIPCRTLELVKRIGGGYFGEVWQALWHKKTPVAVKWLKKNADEASNDEFLAEIR